MSAHEWPIICTGKSVWDILAGRKTMTRRLSPQWMKRKAGDRLWVKETWAFSPATGPHSAILIFYKSDMTEWSCCNAVDHVTGEIEHNIKILPRKLPHGKIKTPSKWKSPLFMPRWASRLSLDLVADPRWERLGDISDEDVRKEGYATKGEFFAAFIQINNCTPPMDTPVVALEFRMVKS